MKKAIRIIGLASAISLSTSGCVTSRFNPHEAFRSPDAAGEHFCTASETVPGRTYSHVDDFQSKCSIQRHHISINNEGRSERIEYTLAFLEFGPDGELLDPGQRQALSSAIRNRSDQEEPGNDQNASSHRRERYVIFFVHGWRNNASRFTRDPYRFQTALAYMTSYIAQRCKGECKPEVTGVYVGWPGATLNERPNSTGATEASSISTARVSLTFGKAFVTSNNIGPTVVQEIKEIIDEVRSVSSTDGTEPRFLTIGHSAGANLLMSGLTGTPGDTKFSSSQDSIRPGSPLDESLNGYRRDSTLDPVLGDLVVLFAPASPASRWVSLQQRQLRGIDPEDRDPCQQSGCGWRAFPANQRPLILAVTSACTTGLEAKRDGNNVECDRSVNNAFSLYQTLSNPSRLLRGRAGRQERTAIGYYSHEGKVTSGESAYFGVSHFVTDNSRRSDQGRPPTSLESLREPSSSKCVSAFPWLEAARAVKHPEPAWDISGTISANRGRLANNHPRRAHFDRLVEGRPGDSMFGSVDGGALNVQWIFTHNGINQSKRAMTDSNTPFWNSIAHSSVMEEHGGFYSHPLLCSLTQLWLDPVVGSDR
ncbi:hypothetical protein [Silanimonas sp.]|jgi:hypothetical protein|uniref:hypothetical protein n=1 Tax=Silanimonas sp. TaxID=1929290 RepID=UPI0037CB7369